MTIRPWMIQAALIASLCCFTAWLGWSVCDTRWTQQDTDRKLAESQSANALSEQYRIKERKLNDTIGEIETRAINDAANAEMEYKAVMDRLRNASAHPADGLRIKPTLTCRAVPNNTSTTGNGNEAVQAGLSPEIAERVIGIGAECNQVVTSLDACQAYVELLLKDNKKPLY